MNIAELIFYEDEMVTDLIFIVRSLLFNKFISTKTLIWLDFMILALCHCTFPPKPLYGIDYVFSLLKLGKLIAFPVSLHNWNNLQLEIVLNEYSGQTFVSLENFSFTKERTFFNWDSIRSCCEIFLERIFIPFH